MLRENLVSFVVSVGFSICCVGQTPSLLTQVTSHNESVQITHGPVVESVTDTTAIVAWSTNVNAGTVLHYGTDPQHLDLTAGMPWGGLTHRINLKDLKPATIYYFQAESPSGQGTGTRAATAVASFQTKPAAQVRERQILYWSVIPNPEHAEGEESAPAAVYTEYDEFRVWLCGLRETLKYWICAIFPAFYEWQEHPSWKALEDEQLRPRVKRKIIKG